MSFSHRTGPLKQQNKKHHNVKGKEFASTGRLRKPLRTYNKRERREMAKQKRRLSVSTLKTKLSLRGIAENPIWCVLVPLSPRVPVHLAMSLFQQCDPDATTTYDVGKLQHALRIHLPSLDKHICCVPAKDHDLFGTIDLILLADWVILLVPSDFTEFDASTENFLTALYGHGLGAVSFAVMSPGEVLTEIKHTIEMRFPIPEDTIYPLNTTAHAISLLHHICSTQNTKVGTTLDQSNSDLGDSRSAARFRARLLADSVAISDTGALTGNTVESTESATSDTAYLVVEGLLRGASLHFQDSLEQLASEDATPCVHLAGWGDFPLYSASWSNAKTGSHIWSICDDCPTSENVTTQNLSPTAYRTFTDDEMDDSDCSDGTDSVEQSSDEEMEDDQNDGATLNEKVTGSMDVESEREDNTELDEDYSVYASKTMASSKSSVYSLSQLAKFRAARMEEMFPDEVETPPNIPARQRFAKYRCLPRFQGSAWPIENDIFPSHYENIACFKNYHRNRRSIQRYLHYRARKHQKDKALCIVPGSVAKLVLGPLKHSLAHMILRRHTPPLDLQTFTPDEPVIVPPLVVWSLLPHETRISVCHFTMRRVTAALRATSDMIAIADAANKAAEMSSSLTLDTLPLELGEEASSRANMEEQIIRDTLATRDNQNVSVRRSTIDSDPAVLPLEAEPIKSKDLMFFQVGIRRFVAAPIYSTLTTSSSQKAKFEQFFPTQSCVVATVYAPVMYAPANVLQFRIRVDEDERGNLSTPYLGELVAIGTLHSVDPSRLIIKRIFLSGHPYKIRQRNAVVRFMFFNPADVEYFKSVPLQTKTGVAGHIKESVGTHGYMKCVFDRILQASDVVLMPLYKRVFPKWIYQPIVMKVLQAKMSAEVKYAWKQAPVTLQLTQKRSRDLDDDASVAEQMILFS